jgi:hypothetical protein
MLDFRKNAVRRTGLNLELEMIVFLVAADPEPNEAIGALFGQCSIMKTNPCCPKLSNLLETNRGVMRVGLKQSNF